MNESRRETPVSSVYESVLGLVEELRRRAGNNPRLLELLSWFPDLSGQREVEAADFGTRARFAAEVLGHMVNWDEEVRYLHLYRPQDRSDRGTAVGDLELSRAELSQIIPLAQEITRELYFYADYLLSSVLKEDFAAVASQIKTAGQAFGFHQMLRTRSEQATEQTEEEVRIVFDDGAPAIGDSVDAALYLEGIKRDAPVESASYDPRTNKLEIRFREAEGQSR